MKEALLKEIEQKKATLAENEQRCKQLDEELARFEDPAYQARLIEEALAAYYATYRGAFPIDRSLEPDIAKTLRDKSAALGSILADHAAELRRLDAKEQEECRNADNWYGYPRSMIYPGAAYIPYYYTAAQRRSAEAQERRNDRAAERLRRDLLKRKQDALKNIEKQRETAGKNALEAIRRLFLRVEGETTRYYIYGVSRENLQLLVELLRRIRESGMRFGTVPVTMLRKINSWDATARKMPEDKERKDREKEAAEKQKLQKKLEEELAFLQQLQQKQNEANGLLQHSCQQMADIENSLTSVETGLPVRIEQLHAEAAQKRQQQLAQFEADKKELEDACAKTRQQLLAQRKEEEALGQTLMQAHIRLTEEKQLLEAQYSATAFLNIVRRTRLKKQIALVGDRISQNAQQLQAQQARQEALERADPEEELQRRLAQRESLRDHELAAITEATAQGLAKLERERSDLKQKLELTKKQVDQLKEEIKSRASELKKAERRVANSTQKLETFHEDYLIRTFGKKEYLPNHRQAKEQERARLAAATERLKEELAALRQKVKEQEAWEALLQRLREAMPEDLYFIEEAKRIYSAVVPEAEQQEDLHQLKAIGFAVRAKYVLRSGMTLDDYLRRLLQTDGVLDLEALKQRYGSLGSWNQLVSGMKYRYDIVEFEPGQALPIGKLEKAGVTKASLEQFCESAHRFVEDGAYFTAKSLRLDGHEAELYELGFSDWFYSSVLAHSSRFSTCRLMGATVLHKGGGEVNAHSFVVSLILGQRSIDLLDLLDLLDERYGCEGVTKTFVKQSIRGTPIYYDPILDRLYADAELYYQELDEEA